MSSPRQAERVPRGPRFRVRYLVALSLIATLTIPFQAIIQYQLADASTDATLINLAGRQRMLSQRINHQAAAVIFAPNLAERATAMSALDNTVAAWVDTHHTLANGGPGSVSDSGYPPEIRAAYRQIGPLIDEIAKHAYSLAAPHSHAGAEAHLVQIYDLTERFLPLMHRTVGLHEAQADAKVTRLKRIELALLIGTLVLLVLEALLVFEPAALALRRQRRELDRRADELAEAVHAAEHASGVKSIFLANISHEIRTPLSAVIGSAELLKASRDAAERDDLVRTISVNAEHLLDLINDVLDLTKIEAGQLTLDAKRAPLLELIAQTESIIRPHAVRKRLGLDFRFATPVPRHVVVDVTRARQVLINLLSNAIKFTDQGGVTVTCGYDTQRPQPLLWFDVADTGIGLKPDRLDAIFNAFEQADKSTTRRYGGTGLGLAVSRTIAHAMLGDLVVTRSSPGQGSTFRFTFEPGPLEPADLIRDPRLELNALRRANLRDDPVDEPGSQDLTGRVLIAEDSPENQKLLRYFLKRTRIDATFVGNGRDAVQAVEDRAADGEPFDAVLMDMQMPVMDGPTAVRAIRAAGHDTPVVAFTANAAVEDRNGFAEAGCTGFLAKPVKPDEFIDAIRRALSSRRATDEPPARAA